MVSAAGTLLWMTHALIQEHGWMLQGPGSNTDSVKKADSFAGSVNLLPARRYKLSAMAQDDADVHVRALLVGTKLFVHFVSTDRSVRVSLKYVCGATTVRCE